MPDTNLDAILIKPAREIFDSEGVKGQIDEWSSSGLDTDDLRNRAVKLLSSQITSGKALIAETSLDAFKIHPYAAFKAVASYSYLTDCVVQTVIKLATGPLHEGGITMDSIAVMAVGGYGRAEMAPHSDVDLLFLTSDNRSEMVGETIEKMLYILWDLKLKVGHSVRSIKDCIQMAKSDLTIRTAMLECRQIWGKPELASTLKNRLWKDVYKGTGPAFVEAKLKERENRYKRQGGNRYMLEPNVKEGKGGLRDLQTLFWIMKYIYHVDDKNELIQQGVFTIEEFEKFLSAEAFLWGVRCELHRIANRTQDVLHFDAQTQIAESLGYQDAVDRSAVEYFMQDYFGHATDVGELTRIFLTKMEEQHVKRLPKLPGILQTASLRLGRQLPPEYKLDNGRLNIREPDRFLKNPVNIIRLFETGLATNVLIHPDAFRLVASNLHYIDESLQNNPDAKRIFIDLLLEHGNPERSLRRMNETGVLGRFIPEFHEIVAMMQYNSYHQYTVDEHTIQCISILARIERGELKETLPVASSILEKGVNRRVLYIAMLLHDIGKGRKEDHSVLGARIVRDVAPRLGLDANECDLVEWLVANHLLMSDCAQKRDIHDPATVKNFAGQVMNRTRLKLLTVLTVCDIMGVGPGVWNDWKAQMLRDLYRITHTVLTEGLPNIDAEYGVEEARKNFRKKLQGWGDERLDYECERFPPFYWQGMPTDTQVAVAHMLDDIGIDEVRIDLTQDKVRGATRVCFAMAETPGLFSRLAGILLLIGAQIVDARMYTSSDNHAVVAMWLQDSNGGAYEEARLVRMKKQIQQYVDDPETTEAKLKDPSFFKQRFPFGQRDSMFVVPTEISIDNNGSEYHTIIEVDTRDRIGLLYDLARALHEAQVVIVRAVIATYGAQAVDVFYVKDRFGMKLFSDNRRKNLSERLRKAINPEIGQDMQG